MENTSSNNTHSVTIRKGKNTVVTDVAEILSFDETYVELKLSDSVLSIEGNELRIISFFDDKNEVTMSGEVVALSYSKDKHIPKTGGFMKRLLGSAD